MRGAAFFVNRVAGYPVLPIDREIDYDLLIQIDVDVPNYPLASGTVL